MSPEPILPGLFLPCSRPQLLSAAAGGGLEPSPVRRFRGALPHRLLSCAKEPPFADSVAHGTLRKNTSAQIGSGEAGSWNGCGQNQRLDSHSEYPKSRTG